MIKTYNNFRVEKAGRKVQLFRFEKADVAVSRWRGRTRIYVFLHGATDPVWLRVRDSAGRDWEVDGRDLDAVMVRDPKAKLIGPEAQPWEVIAFSSR